MVYDDAKALVQKYISIADFLYKVNGTLEVPTIGANHCGIDISLYNGDKHCDPWKALIDIELQCGVKLEIKDLVAFNVMNVGFWKESSYSQQTEIEEVFSINSSIVEQSISYELFLACCIALCESKARNTIWFDHFDGSKVRHYAMEQIALMDKLKPTFFAKLFTEDVKRFMSCIEYSKSIELPTFIVKSFMQKIPLNKTMFRTIVSLFKQEMAMQRLNSMFMN